VKLLFDENLSHRLVSRIDDLFPGSAHVRLLGLEGMQDRQIWEHARSQGFAIVSADADFYELATTAGPPPKLIWLRGCDYPTSVAEELIRAQSIRIVDFLNDRDRSVLILRPRVSHPS
jgi:predicted nuclease of predicted toxin-antitoxin system